MTRYYYDGQKIVETRVGDNPTTYYQQFIHGTQYIDELVMMRVKGKGDLYVHQDANWNVIGLTDLGGHLVERYVLTPYGEVTIYQETGYGDRDGDGDVDATDKGTPGSTCTGTVSGECRILDLDFDGDYDSTDAGLFDSLPQGLARHPGRIATAVHQPFAHQGLLYEPELGQYQNRARQYDPGKRRFAQRDPLGYTDALSLYVYAVSNPLGSVDPTGRACSPVGATIDTLSVYIDSCTYFFGLCLGDLSVRMCRQCNGTSYVIYAVVAKCEGTPGPCPAAPPTGPPPTPCSPWPGVCEGECSDMMECPWMGHPDLITACYLACEKACQECP